MHKSSELEQKDSRLTCQIQVPDSFRFLTAKWLMIFFIMQIIHFLSGGSPTSNELCPYAVVGECRFGVKCAYLHGLKCDFCGMACLHPYCPRQREAHSRVSLNNN